MIAGRSGDKTRTLIAAALFLLCTFGLDSSFPRSAGAVVPDEDLLPIDDDLLEIRLSRAVFNRRTGQTSMTATLTNTSPEVIEGPILLAIEDISSFDVSVINFDDLTEDDTPIFVLATEALDPGQSLSQEIIFSNATRTRFNFTPQAFVQISTGPEILEIGITSPVNGFLTSASEVEVVGTVGDGVDTIEVNGISATLSFGNFSAIVPLREGNNTVTAVARNDIGGLGSSSVLVIRDTTPPAVAIETPTSNQIVSTSTVDIVGMVNDIVTGTVNEANCQVMVSGRAGSAIADVSNRTFQVRDFPLVPGPNTITVVAMDAAGNESAPAVVDITRQDLAGQRLQVLSGNQQSGEIGAELPQLIVVRAVDAQNMPLPGRILQFRVVRNNGLLRPARSAVGQPDINVVTDTNGEAAAAWTLGNRVGVGNNRVEVSGVGFAAPAIFSAAGPAGPCDKLLAMSGENQVGVVGEALAHPLEVVAFDEGGNFCVGTPVTFSVEEGGGNFGGAQNVTVDTNSDGRASATLVLGPEAGTNNNVVSTSSLGLEGQTATFIASAVEPGAEASTRFVGVVLDTENGPVPNALVKIEDADPPVEGFTDDNGQFALDDIPVGSGLLFVDGSTTTRPGVWPTLEFQIDVIAGIDNSLGMPIFLPELDNDSFQLVGGDEDVVLSMAGVEGFALRIFADSVTFPDGSPTGFMGVTQVSNDQVPMPPTGGAAPPWVGTLQPAGVMLEPPAQLTVPNSLGLPPGQIVDMFSFDHDLQQFVGVGTGTVQEDGATIVSDPGSGIRKSGWFFDCPPPPEPVEVFNSQNPLANDEVRDIFEDALNDSAGGTADEHEEGGWLIRDQDGDVRVQRWPRGNEDTITPDEPNLNPGEEVFGSFHTHPENPEFESEPSQADIDSTQTTIEDFGLTDSYEGCFIVNDNAIWHVDTDGNVSQVSNSGP